jgi:phosphonate transport system ATP-binding protein
MVGVALVAAPMPRASSRGFRLTTPSGTDNPTIVLELVHLSRRFGSTMAVANVSLRIDMGEMVGIIGRSGAGKSTLLRLINRMIEPTEGAIRSCGADISALRGKALRQWRARTAMIFQQFNLVHRLDVLTNVLCGRLHDIGGPRMLLKLFTEAERVDAISALDRMGLAELAMNRADALSGGQQQRVAIARALMQKPGIILADEPIASLDPMNAKVVMDALADINRRDGITVLCNLHTLDTARAYCNRIVGMSAGRIVFDGAPEQLTDRVLRDIYGEHPGASFDERITSTSLSPVSMPAMARI